MKTPFIAIAAVAAALPSAGLAQEADPIVMTSDLSHQNTEKSGGLRMSIDDVTTGVATDGRTFAQPSISVSGTGEPLLDQALSIGLAQVATIGNNFQNDPFNDINSSMLLDVGPTSVLLSARSTMDSTGMRTKDDALFDPADLFGAGKLFHVGGSGVIAGVGVGMKDGDVAPTAILRNNVSSENALRKLNWQMTGSHKGITGEARMDLSKNIGASAFASTNYGLGARVHGRMNISNAFNVGAQLSYTTRHGPSVGAQLNYQRGDTQIGLGVELGKGVHDHGNASGFLTLTQNLSGLRKIF